MEEERKVGKIKIDEEKFNAVKGALRNGLGRGYIVDLLKEINDKLGKEEQPEPEKKRGWFSKAPF